MDWFRKGLDLLTRRFSHTRTSTARSQSSSTNAACACSILWACRSPLGLLWLCACGVLCDASKGQSVSQSENKVD